MFIITGEFDPVGITDILNRFYSFPGDIDRLDTILRGNRELLSAIQNPVGSDNTRGQDENNNHNLDDGIPSFIENKHIYE